MFILATAASVSACVMNEVSCVLASWLMTRGACGLPPCLTESSNCWSFADNNGETLYTAFVEGPWNACTAG